MVNITPPPILLALLTCPLEVARTVAQRKSVMGHKTEVTFDPYFAHFISIDTQSGFLDMPLQQALINQVKGMTARRDLRAPKPKSASLLGRVSIPRPRKGVRKTSTQNSAKIRREKRAFKTQYLEFFTKVSADLPTLETHRTEG